MAMMKRRLILTIGSLFLGACASPPTSVPTQTAVLLEPTTSMPSAPAEPTEPMPDVAPSPTSISASPVSTQPAATPQATVWQTYNGQGFELEYPGDWTVYGPDGIECAAMYYFYPTTLKLIHFSACWQETVGGNMLTFEETYERFREAFVAQARVSTRTIHGIDVEVIQYSNSRSNGIYALTASQGTVALWQGAGTGWALVDEENQYQENGLFERILTSFRFREL